MLPKQNNFTQSQTSAAPGATQLSLLQQAISDYTPLQLAWASGYLAAKSEVGGVVVAPVAEVVASSVLTILFASQTGNAKGVAKKLAEAASGAGIEVNLKNIADYKAKSLKNETHVLIVASTNGEGEPPDDALEFHEFIRSKKAPKLPQLKFSVLSLGDSSYEFFCQTGKDFDAALLALGAKQVAPRVDCDLDYNGVVATWSEQIIADLKAELTANNQSTKNLAQVVNLPFNALASEAFTKEQPYTAELLVSQKITGRDSAKDVRHIEIDLGESGLIYQPGDALGVWFENDATLAEELITALGISQDEQVMLSGSTESVSLFTALTSELEITQTTPSFIEYWAEQSSSELLKTLVTDKSALREYAGNHQVVDIVKAAPATVTAQSFVDALRKITPRLYSIASSQAEVEEEVHLTVGLVSYEYNGQARFGGASSYLGKRLEEGASVKVFVEHNNNFRLPANPETPVIMIGPGTGVAPFRAFMQEREAIGATGDNWMFFGDQTYTQDFLYQVEWQNYVKSGLLTKMDVAFSRDQVEKVYVQDRLKQHSAEVFAWLERGAHLYICGDANRMAKDVHKTLVDIVSEHGKLSNEAAEDYLKSLRIAKRYQKDVY